MSDSLLEAAYHLTQAGTPYVLATVVWCERPTSAKPGAQAIIQEDGQLRGWVGGSCTQPVVVREARRLLREGGEALLLRLGTSRQSSPNENASVRSFPMTCASGGALDIYMEPHLPKPQLLLIGDSPIIVALQQLAPVLDFAVTQLDDTRVSAATIDERTSIVIATHGQYDENILEQVLGSSAAYIGLVSSSRRAAACRAYLREAGLTEMQIARLRAPSGLDIGARTPAEIAASILAELIQERRRSSSVSTSTSEEALIAVPEPTTESTAVDPVCGMIVEIAGARHTGVHAAKTYYFCCPACKRQFEREPARFLAKSTE
ncbi:MAG TPA: XdhC family protein [Ktedonobacteraceae bacterium]|nr:XdhC family protein [Ktedonobacteraceae bacterium]